MGLYCYLITDEIAVPFVFVDVTIQIPHNQPSSSCLCDQFKVSKVKQILGNYVCVKLNNPY